jgi:hypothetical protein
LELSLDSFLSADAGFADVDVDNNADNDNFKSKTCDDNAAETKEVPQE